MTVNGKFLITKEFRGFLTVLRNLQDRTGYETRTVWSDWYARKQYDVQECFEKGMTPQETFLQVGSE